MLQRRYAHGLCFKNEYIYSLGGLEHSHSNLSTCERYNMISDKWEYITSLSEPRYSMTAIIMNNYIYMFGGYEDYYIHERNNEEIICRIDINKLNDTNSKWEYYSIPSFKK
jgi:hypothetical protein